MPLPPQAVTLDFYQTLAFHRDGRGRGRVLMEYLEAQGLKPAPWEHQVLFPILLGPYVRTVRSVRLVFWGVFWFGNMQVSFVWGGQKAGSASGEVGPSRSSSWGARRS